MLFGADLFSAIWARRLANITLPYREWQPLAGGQERSLPGLRTKPMLFVLGNCAERGAQALYN